MIPTQIGRRLQAVPFEVAENGVKVAMTNPNDRAAMDELAGHLNEKILPHVATEDAVLAALGGAENNDATWCYRFYNKDNPSASPVWSPHGGEFDAAASANHTDATTRRAEADQSSRRSAPSAWTFAPPSSLTSPVMFTKPMRSFTCMVK